jgi:hypothetical protein
MENIIQKKENTKKQNRGGRPRLNNALNKTYRIRFNAEEFEKLLIEAKRLNETPGDFIRKMIFNGTISNAFADESIETRKQIIGLGNNLNQLVKLAHTYGLLPLENQIKNNLNDIDNILKKYNYVRKGVDKREWL